MSMTNNNAQTRANLIKARAAFTLMKNEMVHTTTPKNLDTIAQRILTDAKRNAPVRTGALRASGRVKRVNQFRRRVQFGGAGTGVDYAQAVEFGTINTRPRPYLEPAVIKNIKKTPAIVRPSIRKWLTKLVLLGSSD
jgi:HK97 gp10 family phage protein